MFKSTIVQHFLKLLKEMRTLKLRFNEVFFQTRFLTLFQYLLHYQKRRNMSDAKIQHIIKVEPVPEDRISNQYACECGKLYNNYPALYLHFRRKHNQIISTKLESENYTVTRNGPFQVITYLLMISQEELHLDPAVQSWQQLIDQFTDYLLTEKSLGYSAKECLENLKDYLRTLKQEEIHLRYDIEKRLPLFFTNFLGQHRNIQDVYYQRWCNTLRKFSLWLHSNNHSVMVWQEGEPLKTTKKQEGQ